MHANSAARSLRTIDATCPLVTKVHTQARRYAAQGYTVILIGHAGHEEVVGTMGEAPDQIVLVESPEQVETLDFPEGTRLAYVTQTTLSVDETGEMIVRAAARASRTSTRRARRTSVTRPPTGSGRSRRCSREIGAPARRRLAQLVELEPPRRGRARGRRRRRT